MHNIPESPGHVIKTAREKAGITIEDLATRADISERYLYRIKNEGKKPSYDVLYRIIRALNVSADTFFYPEKRTVDTEGPWKSSRPLQRPLSTPPLKSSCKAAFSLFLAFTAFFISKQSPYNEMSRRSQSLTVDHRLCVLASGSLMIAILPCSRSISVFLWYLGQI